MCTVLMEPLPFFQNKRRIDENRFFRAGFDTGTAENTFTDIHGKILVNNNCSGRAGGNTESTERTDGLIYFRGYRYRAHALFIRCITRNLQVRKVVEVLHFIDFMENISSK